MRAKAIILPLLSVVAIYAVLIASLTKSIPLDSRNSFDLAVVRNFGVIFIVI